MHFHTCFLVCFAFFVLSARARWFSLGTWLLVPLFFVQSRVLFFGLSVVCQVLFGCCSFCNVWFSAPGFENTG